MRERIAAAAREPLVHFLLLGGLLFAVDRRLHPLAARDDTRAVVVTRAVRAELEKGFTDAQGRAPSNEETEKLVAAWVDEEVLFREGLARELDRNDPRVRERVVSKMA